MSTDRLRVGVLVPSSNTNVEPLTSAVLASVPGTSAHFTRFSLPGSLDDPIDHGPLVEAADLLMDAGVDVLVFHGTAGSWLGVDGDRALCAALTAATGVPATTATLATVAALRALGITAYGLAFPGPEDIAIRIAAEYAAQGLRCAHHVAAGLADNLVVGAMAEAEVRRFVAGALAPEVDAVAVIGTNFPATRLVASLEDELGVPVVDSTAAVAWQVLAMTGRATAIKGWGALLAGAAPPKPSSLC